MAIPTDKPITGIPDPTEFGDPSSLPLGQVLPFIVQEHLARRAGKHYDVRLGPDNMFSWATKKGLPAPGVMQALFQTPLHEQSYMNFEGELPEGMYGAGKVRPVDKGSVVVHSASPNKIVFTTAHTRYPQTYAMVRAGTKPTDWLVKNLNPKSLEDFVGPGARFEKEHYKSVSPHEVGKLYGTKNTISEKIDGARMLLRLRRHAVEAASYRQSKTGYPIMHTERLQLPRNLRIPSELVGSSLIGEAFGERLPEKVSKQLNAHAARIALREARKEGKAPVKEDPKPHTGRDASGMLDGSFLARVVQMGKAGSYGTGNTLMQVVKEVAEETPKLVSRYLLRRPPEKKEEPNKPVLPLLPKIEHGNSMAAQSAPGSTEGVKVAQSAGRVEPQVATDYVLNPKPVPGTLVKKRSDKDPDTRKFLNDKVGHDGSFNPTCGESSGDVDVTMGHDTRRMPRKEWYEAIKNHRLKGPATLRMVNTKAEKVSTFQCKKSEDGQAIPVQELSGILNSSLAESLRKQKEQRVRMRVALFNVLTKGKQDVSGEPYPKRVQMLQEILKHLPSDKFLLPEMATDPAAQKALFERIQSGKNPRTSEGIVSTPETGVPTKVKIAPEFDVVIRRMFPGAGKYEGTGAGGFEYSLPTSEKILGRVGTGISDEMRRDMLLDPEAYLNRPARIRSQGQFPSGAYRAPSLLTVHEG